MKSYHFNKCQNNVFFNKEQGEKAVSQKMTSAPLGREATHMNLTIEECSHSQNRGLARASGGRISALTSLFSCPLISRHYLPSAEPTQSQRQSRQIGSEGAGRNCQYSLISREENVENGFGRDEAKGE